MAEGGDYDFDDPLIRDGDDVYYKENNQQQQEEEEKELTRQEAERRQQAERLARLRNKKPAQAGAARRAGQKTSEPDAERSSDVIAMKTFGDVEEPGPSGIVETSLGAPPTLGAEIPEMMIERAEEKIRSRFPQAVMSKIHRVFNKAKNTVFALGPKNGQYQVLKQNNPDEFMSDFKRVFSKNLGPSAEELISEKAEAIKKLEDSKKEAIRSEKLKAEISQLVRQNEEINSKLDSGLENKNKILEERLRLASNKRKLENLRKEGKTLAFLTQSASEIESKIAAEQEKIDGLREKLVDSKSLDTLRGEEKQLKEENTRDQTVIQDPASSAAEIEAASERVAERQAELERVQTRVEEIERSRPLSERVKSIFKRNGVTVASIFIAAGVTISVLVAELAKGLKETGKVLGSGLKTLGAKISGILPGLLGSVVGFLFKTAGKAVGFIAENSWLLILAVVAFLFERLLKQKSGSARGLR